MRRIPAFWSACAIALLPVVARAQPVVVNPLPDADVATFFHLPEGGAVMPLDWYTALEVIDSTTGQPTGQTFSERMEHYGFLVDDDHELPVGFGVVELEFLSNLPGLSINCAACHVGEIAVTSGDGTTRLRIVGGPNLADLRTFSQDVYASSIALLKDPRQLIEFLQRSGRLKPDTTRLLQRAGIGPARPAAPRPTVKANARPTAVRSTSSARTAGATSDVKSARSVTSKTSFAASRKSIGTSTTRHIPGRVGWAAPTTGTPAASTLAKPSTDRDARPSRLVGAAHPTEERNPAARLSDAMLDVHRNLELIAAETRYFLAQGQFSLTTNEGYGRLDAFATVRILFFPAQSRNFPFTAPVSVPPLWGIGEKQWLHWNANTNSTLQRNIAQAMGMGALQTSQGITNVLFPNLDTLEQLAQQIAPPEWPAAVLGPLDEALVDQGRTLYEARCAGCHNAGVTNPETGLVIHPLFTLAEIGTDPNYALNFHQPVGRKSFPEGLNAQLGKIEQWYYERRDPQNPVPIETQISWAGGEARYPAEWRDPLAGSVDAPVYPALPLTGIWATAPYLHNNSVPTLRDLLRPASERPTIFQAGLREYDPVNVGYQQFADPADIPARFHIDTTHAGNANTGHEGPEFGGEGLTEDEIAALLEYLKSL
jgi:mono/diheme cytochrome c family protein